MQFFSTINAHKNNGIYTWDLRFEGLKPLPAPFKFRYLKGKTSPWSWSSNRDCFLCAFYWFAPSSASWTLWRRSSSRALWMFQHNLQGDQSALRIYFVGLFQCPAQLCLVSCKSCRENITFIWTYPTTNTISAPLVPRRKSTPKNRAGRTITFGRSGYVWRTCQKWFWPISSSYHICHLGKIQLKQCKKLTIHANYLKNPKLQKWA